MNRRGFLAALAAPLIARPTPEDIERLTWKRRYWAGVDFGKGPSITSFAVLQLGDIVTFGSAVFRETERREYVITGVYECEYEIRPVKLKNSSVFEAGLVSRKVPFEPVLTGNTIGVFSS